MNKSLIINKSPIISTTIELALPWAERLTGFETVPGDYLPNRIKILAGRYEAEEIALMRRFIRPGQLVFDVGANVGYLTRFFGRAVGPRGKVYAFEPNPLIFPLLKKNIARLKHVAVFNFGLSTHQAERPLFLAGRDHSVASFVREYPASHVFSKETHQLRSVSAKLVRGDDFMNQLNIDKIDILKIDVEGWELNVLSGLERTIAASNELTSFFEFNPAAQACAGRRPTELFDWFFDRQFALAYPHRGELQTLSRAAQDSWIDTHDPKGFTTIFATRK
jgi:FkbM family methyltransferase